MRKYFLAVAANNT